MEGENFPQLNTEVDTSLEDLNFDQIRQERFDRNRHFLESVNPNVAARVFPGHEHKRKQFGVRQQAAVTIQRFWRGYKGRQIYVSALWEKFEKEDEKQKEKVRYQMEEGELLVENHQLEVLLDDGKTTRRNAGRLYLSKIITIQRAWRSYLEKQASQSAKNNFGDDGDGKDIITSNKSSDKSKVKRLNPFDSGADDIDLVDERPDDFDIENDTDNTENDETCMFNPLNETAVEKGDISSGLINNSVKTANRKENSASLSPRQKRKYNFLNKAQEFAELKKLDSKVLPFDLHLHIDQGNQSDSQEVEMSGTMSTTMPPSVDSGQIRKPEINHRGPSTSFVTGSKFSDGALIGAFKGNNCSVSINDSRSVGSTLSAGKNPQGNNSFICDTQNSESQHICDTKEGNSNLKENHTVCDTKRSNICENKKEVGSKNVPENTSNSGQTDDVENAFDVYNIETALPEMDWASLEEKLKAASEEAKLIQEARRNDREEIRKKLAMGGEDGLDDDDDDDDEITYKKPNIQSRLHSGLQICFMNESPGDTDNEGLSPRQLEIHDNAKLMKKVSNLVDSDNNLSSVTDLNNPAPPGTSQPSSSPPRLKAKEDNAKPEDFHTRQEKLQNEAKLALAQAGSMAHMQLEIEKQLKKKSPMAEMVGIPGLGEKHRKKLSIRQLQQMNLASIQVLYNDLQTQIESLNEELVHLLMERDELHMAQDSMLVDIEDLTRRAEELAERANRTGGNKGNKTNNKGKLPSR